MLTPCSAKKAAPRSISAEDLKPGDQRSVARQWDELVRSTQPLAIAGEIYIGSAFKAARRVADHLAADLFVVSAGLGLVPAGARIPSYGLTFAAGYAESLPGYIDGQFDVAEWWRYLKSGPYSVDLDAVLDPEPALVLVALSRDYCDAIKADLSEIEARLPGRLRIFGLSIERSLPTNLVEYVMPYDSRLETLTKRGTNKDFPQRAMAHFVREVPTLDAAAKDHRAFVAKILGGVEPPSRRRNQSVSDDEVASRIPAAIAAVGHSRDRVLKHIRRVQGVACEERRFRTVYRQWKAQPR